MEILITVILGAILIAGVVLYSAFSWGYVSSILYAWFVLPYFPNLPHLSTLAFIGVALFIGTLIRPSTVSIKKEYKDETTGVINFFLGPWLTLLIAYLIKVIFM